VEVVVRIDVMTLVVVVEAVEVDEAVVEVLAPTELAVVLPTLAAIGNMIASAKASVTRAIVPRAFVFRIAHRWS